MPSDHPRVDLAGIVVDLMDEAEAIEAITARARQPAAADRIPRTGIDHAPPLAVISANLDHIVQFGADGRWRHTLGDSLRPTRTGVDGQDRPLEWLTLLDGAPLVAQSARLTNRPWPRLAGSDLIGPLLDAAERSGITVGFLGGSYLVQRLLSRRLIHTHPGLVVVGMWSPDRAELADEEASRRLAATIAEAAPQLLIVGLGKPRQELWISQYGPATGANVLLAFGAVVDFLADAVQRAPRLASDHGLEWAWRLAREPRRLAKRYLMDDPPGLVQLRRNSTVLDARRQEDIRRRAQQAAVRPPVVPTASPPVVPRAVPTADPTVVPGPRRGVFVPPGHPADVAVLVVTYDSETEIGPLLDSLRAEADGLRLRVAVADNDSTDGTLEVLGNHPDVVVVPTGGNLGYAAGINAAARHAGDVEALLVLNPDLRVGAGSLRSLLEVIRSGGADVVVPRLVDEEGRVQLSLRREPSLTTVLGDALFGGRWPLRPAMLAETDAAPESYQFGHEVDWATGAAVMVRADTARAIGAWDEQFFLYSEETDYFRRARELGARTWYEPAATMMHTGAGSGSSPQLKALMAVNRVRYVRKHHSPRTAALFRAGVVLHEGLRSTSPEHRGLASVVADEARWDLLPGPTATPYPAKVLADFPAGAVIIPAHNEAAVITRTLRSLEPALRTGRVEVLVVCNGCTDDTAALAAAIPGVQVIECPVPSKTAAMNAGDEAATLWPRVYLDADTEISPTTLRRLLEQLRAPVLAARPPYRYDSTGASWPVHAYYRARRRLPSTKRALWGAGVFGLTQEGHDRFGTFPDVTADDYFVDQSFEAAEKAIVPAPAVLVRTPLDTASLLKVLGRNHRGPSEQRERSAVGVRPVPGPGSSPGSVPGSAPGRASGAPASTTSSTAWELVRSVRGPLSAVDALSYSSLAAAPRVYRRRRPAHGADRPAWERDDSSRRRAQVPVD